MEGLTLGLVFLNQNVQIYTTAEKFGFSQNLFLSFFLSFLGINKLFNKDVLNW